MESQKENMQIKIGALTKQYVYGKWLLCPIVENAPILYLLPEQELKLTSDFEGRRVKYKTQIINGFEMADLIDIDVIVDKSHESSGPVSTQKMAYDLVQKYAMVGGMSTYAIKRCAIIAVQEILYALHLPAIKNKGHKLYDSQVVYWDEVIEQIIKL